MKELRNKKAIGLMLIVITTVSAFFAVIPCMALESTHAIGTVDISSVSKAERILPIENVKSSLTDAQKKLSTDVLQLLDTRFLPQGQNMETHKMQMKKSGQFRPAGSVSPKRDRRVVVNDLVYVYIYLTPPAGTQAIEPYVWEVTDSDEANHLAVAWVEVKYLKKLASMEAVRTIRTVMPPLVMTGDVTTTEGDEIHRTYDVRTKHSQRGSGVKVGIISDGVDSRATAQATNDLPPDGSGLTVLSNTHGGDEGTALLEIVHDMVPDADLYFHDCGNNRVAFNGAIDALVAEGCNVICDDVGWITEPFFEDGTIASYLTTVLAAYSDIIYVSAAGNAAHTHYQGDYYNDGLNFHDFSRGSSDYLYVEIPVNGRVIVVLQWNDEFGASSNDYDLYLYKWPELRDPLTWSSNSQDGDGDPIEGFIYTNTGDSPITAEIDVYKYYAPYTKTLEVYIYPRNGAEVYSNNTVPADSIFGHKAVPDAIAVGAIDANDPNNIEFFSSQGPVTISHPSPVSRAKPDLCGVDGVTVTGAGGFSRTFWGTSAAAPHIAAIAAQLRGAYPSETGAKIRTMMYDSAVDLGDPGYDNVSGYGRADALNALGDGSIPEFTTIAIPVVAILGLLFLFSRRKRKPMLK